MESNSSYPVDVVITIESFLDRIDRALIERGMPRNQRNTVCDEVESQIYLLIERKVETGLEVNSALVVSILESMDPPESYGAENGLPDVPVVNAEDAHSQPKHSDRVPQASPWLNAAWSSKWIAMAREHFANEETHTDPVAILGLVLSCFGALWLPLGIGARSEGATVLGLLALFMGTIASGVSFWRIRNSKSKLLGKRYAAIGLMIMPFLFVNIMVALVLIASRLGLVLGIMAVVAALLYINYRVLRTGLAWFEREVPVEVIRAPAAEVASTEVTTEQAPPSANGLAGI